MKVTGLGADIIEVKRVETMARRQAAALGRIFTKKELEYCNAGGKAKYQRLAARFAAKEAVWKALGIAGLKFTDIEVTKASDGRPGIICHDARAKKISFMLSLSHTADYAIANVIAIKCKK
jgi:holo-[acyl-carrier protein] synthase